MKNFHYLCHSHLAENFEFNSIWVKSLFIHPKLFHISKKAEQKTFKKSKAYFRFFWRGTNVKRSLEIFNVVMQPQRVNKTENEKQLRKWSSGDRAVLYRQISVIFSISAGTVKLLESQLLHDHFYFHFSLAVFLLSLLNWIVLAKCNCTVWKKSQKSCKKTSCFCAPTKSTQNVHTKYWRAFLYCFFCVFILMALRTVKLSLLC